MTRTPRFPGVQRNKPYCSPSLSGCFLLTNQRAQKASVCGQLSALESAGDLWYSLKVLPTGQIIYPNPTAYSAFDKAETCEKNSPGWCPSWRIYNMHARYKIVVWTLKSLTLQLLVDFSWKYKNTNRQTEVPTASLPVPSAAQWGLGHLDGFRSFTPWSQVDRTQHQERWSKPLRGPLGAASQADNTTERLPRPPCITPLSCLGWARICYLQASSVRDQQHPVSEKDAGFRSQAEFLVNGLYGLDQVTSFLSPPLTRRGTPPPTLPDRHED